MRRTLSSANSLPDVFRSDGRDVKALTSCLCRVWSFDEDMMELRSNSGLYSRYANQVEENNATRVRFDYERVIDQSVIKSLLSSSARSPTTHPPQTLFTVDQTNHGGH